MVKRGFMHTTKLKFVGMTAMTLILTLLCSTSCTSQQTSQPGTVKVAITSQPSTLDPRYATDAYGMRIASLLFSSLVRVGSDLNVTGDAAKKWETLDNGYRFYLHENLKFSNERRVTAEDILFSFESFQKDDNPFHSAFSDIKNVKVETKDNQLVVELQLKKMKSNFLSSDLPVLRILPKKELLQNEEDFKRNLIGSGPFVFVSKNSNQLVLAANKSHPTNAPKIDRLEFKIIRDDFTRYQKLLRGEVDLAQAEVTASKVKEFEKRPEAFSVFKFPGLSMNYILINMKNAAFQSKKARQALSYALNRNEIIKYKLDGLAEIATSILSPGSPFFNKELSPVEYSPAKAKALALESELNKVKLTLKTSNARSAVENGKVIAHQLRQIGLDIQLQSFEWGTYYGDLNKGQFQLATLRWVGAFDPDIYRIAFHSSELPPGRNRGHYSNPQLDQLLEQGLGIMDSKQRIDHYQEVQKIVAQDLPIIPLWYDTQVAIVNKRIKNYEPSRNGDYYPLTQVEAP